VKLVLEDGSTYAQAARLQVRGVAVNTTTGAVTLRATVPNPQGVLLPGMFVRAVLDQATDPDALLVPQAAVSRNARGEASAWVVGADGKAAKRAITVADSVGNQWRVTAGLAAGDRVIVEGTAKVREGQLVRAVAANATTVAQN
jgi:membrane fusion protein, multidrug efflux system